MLKTKKKMDKILITTNWVGNGNSAQQKLVEAAVEAAEREGGSGCVKTIDLHEDEITPRGSTTFP